MNESGRTPEQHSGKSFSEDHGFALSDIFSNDDSLGRPTFQNDDEPDAVGRATSTDSNRDLMRTLSADKRTPLNSMSMSEGGGKSAPSTPSASVGVKLVGGKMTYSHNRESKTGGGLGRPDPRPQENAAAHQPPEHTPTVRNPLAEQVTYYRFRVHGYFIR